MQPSIIPSTCMKSTHIQIRISPEEKRIFKEAADSAGLSVSEWMRRWLRWQAEMVIGRKSKRVVRKPAKKSSRGGIKEAVRQAKK